MMEDNAQNEYMLAIRGECVRSSMTIESFLRSVFVWYNVMCSSNHECKDVLNLIERGKNQCVVPHIVVQLEIFVRLVWIIYFE